MRQAATNSVPTGIGSDSPYQTELRRLADALPDAREVLAQAEVLSTNERLDVAALPDWTKHIINFAPLNHVRYCNKFLEAVNQKLPQGGFFIGCAEAADQRRTRVFSRVSKWVAHPYCAADFAINRVLPKLRLTKQAYFALTKGRNRVLSRAEILGRVVACGFEIVQHREFDNKLYFVVRKHSTPAYDENPSYGVIFRMKRIGRGGEPTFVYKLRTMHPYAEYLQGYVYESNDLDDNGKIKNDFRIAPWGHMLRRFWIDELPMLYNFVKGDMKLIGVRPISEHYLSLYPKDVAKQRSKFKPGLIPPFYVDLPKNFDEIIASEKKYLDAYERSPWSTDVRYFLLAAHNILIKQARSQ